MKAFLLAAGVGSRLRPITDATPNCMVVIGGQPLLDIWLDAFHRAGVDEVLVNLHHLPDQVLEISAPVPVDGDVETVFDATRSCSPDSIGFNSISKEGHGLGFD